MERELFDDIEDEEGGAWSQVCKSCAKKHNLNTDELEGYPGEGAVCGMNDCENIADYYVTVDSKGSDNMTNMKFQFGFIAGEDCRERLLDHFTKDGDYTREELADNTTEQLAMEFVVSETSANNEYEDTQLTLIDAKIVNDFKVLDKPYTAEEVEKLKDEDGRVKGVVAIDFNMLIRQSMDSYDFLNEYIEELLIGNEDGDGYLSDITYKIVGISDTEDNVVYMEVSGIVEDMEQE